MRARIANDFVDSIPDGDLFRKAAEGLVRELHDPHSAYLTPEKLRALNESTTGHYAGIGIQIDVRDGWITIVAPLPGTPAERAGIQPGDRIVAIDGKSTEGCVARRRARLAARSERLAGDAADRAARRRVAHAVHGSRAARSACTPCATRR